MAWVPGKNDPFYSFNRFMIGTQDKTKSQLGQDYLENNKDATFNRHLASLGFTQGDTSPLAEFARKQEADAILGHKTALAENPTLSFARYLTPLNRKMILNMFSYLTPQARGENRSKFVGPARTLSDM